LDAAGRRSRPRILAERSQLQMAQPSVYLQLRSFGQNRRFAHEAFQIGRALRRA